MITEIEGGPGRGEAGDVVSGGGRRPWRGGAAGRWPWLRVLGTAAVTSAVWAAVLHGTGYGHTQAPDLRGYHLDGSPCTTENLRPLTDALGVQHFDLDPGVTHKGAALDHVACTLSAVASLGDGWTTTYTANVTVDLHKKTDPRTEFEDAAHTQDLTRALSGPGVYIPQPDPGITKAVPGLGDSAYETTSHTRQAVHVLDGGAVLSLTIDAANQWQGTGTPKPDSDGAPLRPALADTTSLRPDLVPTMRTLMRVLSSPASP